MAQQYNINSALHGVNGFGRQFPKVVYNATLAITTDTSFTVPLSSTIGLPLSQMQSSNTYLLIFSYTPGTANVYVALGAAAAAPAGASFAAATSIVNPSAIVVKGGDVVHFFASAANISVSVEVWPWQE